MMTINVCKLKKPATCTHREEEGAIDVCKSSGNKDCTHFNNCVLIPTSVYKSLTDLVDTAKFHMEGK